MGNPQPKVQEWEIGWLAGMLDADGSIMINSHRKHGGKIYVEPHIAIYGTDVPTLNKLTNILERMELAHYADWNGNAHGFKKATGQKRRLWRLKVVGLKRCDRFTRAFMGFLTTKQPQLELLVEFVNRRLSKSLPGRGRALPDYDEREINIVNEIRILNRGLGSETKRWVPNY